MNAIKLTFSFLMVPRLFLNLFFLPIMATLAMVAVQLVLSIAFIQTGRNTLSPEALQYATSLHGHPLRNAFLEVDGPLEEIKVCDWTKIPAKASAPVGDCEVEKFDVVLRPSILKVFPLDNYVNLLDKKFKRIHLCETCKSDIILQERDGKVISNLYSAGAFSLLRLAGNEDKRSKIYGGIKQNSLTDEEEGEKSNLEILDTLFGDRLFFSPGFLRPASMNDIAQSVLLLGNIAFLIIGVLWLGLKAHRKVLDYFSHSSVLLPLVATAGKGSFYLSIWILTFLRVAFFLSASIPVMIMVIKQNLRSDLASLFYYSDPVLFSFWIVSILSSLGLGMLLGSIGELKEQVSIGAIILRFLPFILSIAGSAVWLLTFLSSSESYSIVRTVISAIPVLGLFPLLVAPILPPPNAILVFHVFMSAAIMGLILKNNAGWFAAHLDDI